jgi:hypothetical protein
MVYAPDRRRVLMFGGQAGDDKNTFGDLWEWDGDRWTLISSRADLSRSEFGMVYDTRRKVIVMFGGVHRDVDGCLNDTWEWDGTDWHQAMTAHQPSARFLFVMAYNPKRNVVVVADGDNDTLSPPVDTWEYNGSDWSQISTTTPTDLTQANAAYDAAGGRLLVYGGNGTSGISTKTWSYDTSWHDLSQTTPAARFQHQLAGDFARGQIVMFGGVETGSVDNAQTWVWDGSSWSLPAPATMPTNTLGATSAYDRLTGLTWMFGEQVANNPTNNLWSFDGANWKQYLASGPSARGSAMLAYDAKRKNLVLFGGGTGPSTASSETWLWDGAAWHLATPTTSPTPSAGGSMVYDSKRERVVLFAGTDASNNVLDDTWEWDGTDWHPTTPSTKPPGRILGNGVYDPVRGPLFGFGLSSFNLTTLNYQSDLWAWDGTTWTSVSPMAPIPARGFNSLVYEPVRQRTLLFGGAILGGSSAFADSWDFDGTAWNQVLTQQHPPSRFGHLMTSSRNGSDEILYGGQAGFDNGAVYSDIWRLRYASDEPSEHCMLDVDDDHDGLAGCADPDCWSVCTPLCMPGETCDPAASRCGDGVCNTALENCRICPQDCTCTPVCGDGFCDSGETNASCPGDCP